MVTSGNLPPQAYTREVLIKAYEWLAQQPLPVRERATTADSLVALYLQAKRKIQGDDGIRSHWEQPPSQASVDAFKADLRSLAEGLRQFDDPFAAPPTPVPVQTSSASVTSPLPGFGQERISAPHPLQPPAPFVGPGPMVEPQWPQPTRPQVTPTPPFPQPAFQGEVLELDEKTRTWAKEVQSRLNLSSEADALRALIAIGYERLRDLLPRP